MLDYDPITHPTSSPPLYFPDVLAAMNEVPESHELQPVTHHPLSLQQQLQEHSQEQPETIFMRIREMGFENNEVSSECLIGEEPSSHSLLQQQVEQSKLVPICREKVSKLTVSHHLQAVCMSLSHLKAYRQHIQHEIQQYRFEVMTQVMNLAEEWQKQPRQQSEGLVEELEGELQECRFREEQMNREIHSLIAEKTQLLGERQELRGKVRQMEKAVQKMGELEEQIRYLSSALNEKTDLVATLQQKMMQSRWKVMEKEHQWQQLTQQMLSEQQQKIEEQFQSEVVSLKESLKIEAMKSVEHDYEIVIDRLINQQKHEATALKKEISDLESEKNSLMSAHSEYEARIFELEYNELNRTNDSRSNFLRRTNPRAYVPPIENPQKSITHTDCPSQAHQGDPHDKKEEVINRILSRIRLRHGASVASQINQSVVSSVQGAMHPVVSRSSSEASLIEKEKDMRMKSISYKLEQLRADIRREIGQISQ